jgi:NAD(P)-dependent dehydrogenase (short-subunit alcohol dehydrogenase family)
MHVPAPVTLVTGASRGIGEAVALRFQERGDKVHPVWRTDPEIGESLREQFLARVHRADLSEQGAAERLVERLLEIDGKLDHLVHCVGDFLDAPLVDTEPEDWRRLLESNLMTAVELVDAAREPLRASGGTVVLVGVSGAGRAKGRRRTAAHAAAKSALITFARSLALEEAPFGVRVNTVSPGLVAHPGADPYTQDAARAARVPLGRAGTVEEVAEAVLWLSSPGSSYVVGADLVLSGGWGD